MSARYKLKTGQINFESLDNPGAYSCIVIKDGQFYNLSEDLRQMLIEKLQQPQRAETTSLEDMF
jgi:hypothetical protein